MKYIFYLFTSICLTTVQSAHTADDFPPNWLPVETLDRETAWDDDKPPFTDRVRVYLPSDEPVRGVFVCFVFHSADPREVADAWNFALVTVTRDTINDLGMRDRKTGKRTLGYKDQGMGLLSRSDCNSKSGPRAK